MTIPFVDFFRRLREATGISSQTALAQALGVHRSAVTQAKLRDAVPSKWILALARRYTLSPDWLEFGTGAARPAPGAQSPRPLYPAPAPQWEQPWEQADEELVYVPKAAARLCAGGGSFEVEAEHLAEYPMPYRRLAALGRPASMVFMDVVGSSMEPGICDGDMVLVDRSRQRLENGVFAVGVEDAIYLKRLLRQEDALVLRSDNREYADMRLTGDELRTFRMIGKVVWLCRDCR